MKVRIEGGRERRERRSGGSIFGGAVINNRLMIDGRDGEHSMESFMISIRGAGTA